MTRSSGIQNEMYKVYYLSCPPHHMHCYGFRCPSQLTREARDHPQAYIWRRRCQLLASCRGADCGHAQDMCPSQKHLKPHETSWGFEIVVMHRTCVLLTNTPNPMKLFGALRLAVRVLCSAPLRLLAPATPLPTQLPPQEKIEIIAKRTYGAADVSYSPAAEEQIASFERMGFGALPICMAKTQYSLSHDATLKGGCTHVCVSYRDTVRP